MSSAAGPELGHQVTGPAGDPQQRRRRGLRRSARDMLWSTLVIVGIAAVIILLLPRPNAAPIQAVDVAGVAQGAADRLAFTPAVPQGLPPGWTPTSAGVRDSGDGILTWHIGYLTPDGRYASIEQAVKATDEWENIMDSGGTLRAPQVVDGTQWEQRFKDVRDVTALIHRGDRGGGPTTMVTSKGGGLANAVVLARSIPASQR